MHYRHTAQKLKNKKKRRGTGDSVYPTAPVQKRHKNMLKTSNRTFCVYTALLSAVAVERAPAAALAGGWRLQ